MASLDKILVTGGNGALGNELDFGIKLPIEEMDVTSPDSISSGLDKYHPSGVLCLSSVNIRDCEKNPYLAFRVNTLGVYNVAAECRKRNIPVIIISSGAIFNGDKNAKFSESSLPNPQNIYGQSKYCAELLVQAANPKYLILRTGWLFGFSKSTNFFGNFINLAREGREILATTGQFGSPTYIQDFISASKRLIQADETGIFHVVNSGAASAYDIAEKVVSALGSKSKIRAISNDEAEKSGPARSQSEVLYSMRLPKAANLRPWKKAFDEYVSAL